MIDKNSTKIVKKRRLSKVVVYTLYVISIIASIVVAQIFTNKKISDIVVSSITMKETGSIDYKVNFNENPFYNESKGKGDLIVSKYVSNIDTTFNYYVNYNDVLEGEYTYSIKAILYVYEPGDESNKLWDKEYELVPEKTIKFDHKNDYRITENVKLDYQTYYNDYDLYKSKTPIGSSAKLVLEMDIKNSGKYKSLVLPLNNKGVSKEKLIIPISYNSFKIEDNVDLKFKKETFNKVTSNKDEKNFNICVGIVMWVIAVVLIINFIITYNNNVKKENVYDRKIKKIVSTYDNILVRIEKIPALKDMNVVEVSSFDELVDAQSEIRLPINFLEDKKRKIARFFIVRNDMVWIYALREGDLNEEK